MTCLISKIGKQQSRSLKIYLVLKLMHFLLSDTTSLSVKWASLVAQRVKHLPVIRKTQVRFLGREDPLEKEMATHSSINLIAFAPNSRVSQSPPDLNPGTYFSSSLINVLGGISPPPDGPL